MVVFSLMGWSPHIPSEFLVFRRTRCILLKTLSPTRLSLCFVQLSNCLRLEFLQISIPEPYFYSSFGLLRVRSPLLTESFLLSFPPGTKMFQFPGFPSYTYGFSIRYPASLQSEFPHSDICGLQNICFSPQLFAACHVLLRRHVPRHPPYALCSLIFLKTAFSLFVYLSLLNKNSTLLTRLISFIQFKDLQNRISFLRINQLIFKLPFCTLYLFFLFYAVVNLQFCRKKSAVFQKKNIAV